MSQPSPSSSTLSASTLATPSVVAASPAAYRRASADLQRLEASLPMATLSRNERERLRRRGAYPREAIYACVALVADPACAGRCIELPRDEVDAKLLRVDEANRLARALRRLARHVSDDALVVSNGLAVDTMQALDVLDVMASRPGGEHLRARVDEARALVRRDRRAAPRARAKKEDAPSPVPNG